MRKMIAGSGGGYRDKVTEGLGTLLDGPGGVFIRQMAAVFPG